MRMIEALTDFLREEKEAVSHDDVVFYLTGNGDRMSLIRKFLKAKGVSPRCIRSQAYWIEGKRDCKKRICKPESPELEDISFSTSSSGLQNSYIIFVFGPIFNFLQPSISLFLFRISDNPHIGYPNRFYATIFQR